MLIGYARVSKSDGSQTLAPQRDALIGAGVEPDRIYQDLASGRHDARPGLSACLKALQPGNTLVLWKLDRLGRDLKHLVETAESLRVRGIASLLRSSVCCAANWTQPAPANSSGLSRQADATFRVCGSGTSTNL